MSKKSRLTLPLVFLLALLLMSVVHFTRWLAWADTEPLLDSEGEAVGQVVVTNSFCGGNPDFCAVATFSDGEGGGTSLPLRKPIVEKFFAADFHPNADPLTGSFRRYGVALFRGDSTTSAVLAAVVAKVNPNDPKIVHLGPMLEIKPPSNNFFAGKAEAVLAVSSLDPSGNNNGSMALVVSGTMPDKTSGAIVVLRNAWGEPKLDLVSGLTGPVSVAIDDVAQEVIVVEQTEDGEGELECAVGKSPLRFFSLATGDENLNKRLCIDGVGDSADIEIDRAPGHVPRAFISRSFSVGGVSVINLNTYTEEQTFTLYAASAAQPAPGLDLDLGAAMGYLAAPQLGVGGVLPFSLSTGQPDPNGVIPADVYYHLQNSVPTGLQEVSVANHPDPINSVRRGIVISRGDPDNYPNRADEVTRINLVTRNTNRQNTGHQTQVVSFVPQRSTDQANQLFYLRIKTLSGGTDTRLKLKKYDATTVP